MTQGFMLAPSEGFGKPLMPTADAAWPNRGSQGQLHIPTAVVCFLVDSDVIAMPCLP